MVRVRTTKFPPVLGPRKQLTNCKTSRTNQFTYFFLLSCVYKFQITTMMNPVSQPQLRTDLSYELPSPRFQGKHLTLS